MRRSEARTKTPLHGKEVTRHNVGYSGEARRANTWPPGPVADGWRTGALYTALCPGYRPWVRSWRTCEPHGKAGSSSWCGAATIRSTRPCGEGGSGRSTFMAGNGADAEELRDELLRLQCACYRLHCFRAKVEICSSQKPADTWTSKHNVSVVQCDY